MIEKIIHLIWFGELTVEQLQVIDDLKKFNPDFKINLINEPMDFSLIKNKDVIQCLKLIHQNQFYKSFFDRNGVNYFFKSVNAANSKKIYFTKISDCLRYYLINKYGGIYVDLDIKVMSGFDDELLNNKIFICGVKNKWVDIFFIGCEKNSLTNFINEIKTEDKNIDTWFFRYKKETTLINTNDKKYIIHLYKRQYKN